MRGPDLLKTWRGEMLQKDAAEKLGASQSSLSDWENGQACPRVDQAVHIAKVTGGAVPVESWAKAKKASARHSTPARGTRRTGT